MTTSDGTTVRLTARQRADAKQAGSPVLGRLSAAAVVLALLIMVGANLVRGSWMPPALALPKIGPPWELTAHVSVRLVAVLLWAAALIGLAGVLAGLVATRRGQPVPLKTLIVAAVLAIGTMAVLPPAGSTDALDYAVYGHIVALGRNPYVMTPLQYKMLVHLRNGVPRDWEHIPSVYGPLATALQFAAAKVAGASLARTVFWLKLCDVIGFAAVAVAADRLLRADRLARVRAHLLWTANPLLIWSLIAAGHIDVLAAAFGLAGLLMLDRWNTSQPLVRAVVVGLCVGAAADIKIDYALFALAVAWVLRRRRMELLTAAAGALVVLLPSYLVAGVPAIKALAGRTTIGKGYGFYGLVFHHLGISRHYAVPVAIVLMIPLVWLALSRLPRADEYPAIRAGVAFATAWLFLWPEQFAWYSVLTICVLLFYPASRLDWIAVGWLGAITYVNMPGLGTVPGGTLGHTVTRIQSQNIDHVWPVAMLVGLIAFVVLCLNQRWHGRSDLVTTT
jgi:hypothetical protein